MSGTEVVGLVGFVWIIGFVFGCMFGTFLSDAHWRGYAQGLKEQLDENAENIEEIRRSMN